MFFQTKWYSMNPIQSTIRLIEDFDLNNERFQKSIKIFRRSPYGYRILLEIMRGHYQITEEKITIEYLCKVVQNLASRITVNNFIKETLGQKLLENESDSTDGRLKIITPSNLLVKDYEQWLKIVFNG
jgi:hypothetical protein